jgi:hypothetical protein
VGAAAALTVRPGAVRATAAPWRYLVLGALLACYFVLMFIGLQTAAAVPIAAVPGLTSRRVGWRSGWHPDGGARPQANSAGRSHCINTAHPGSDQTGCTDHTGLNTKHLVA